MREKFGGIVLAELRMGCPVIRAIILAAGLVLAACVTPTGQPTEQTWLQRYCAASTPALRAAIRAAMGLQPGQELGCPGQPLVVNPVGGTGAVGS